MGNSNGNLDEYWAIVRTTEQVQGGFIWDWVDQGIYQRQTRDKSRLGAHGGVCSDGRGVSGGGRGLAHWGYGGDFDDPVHDGQFCCNGLIWPDVHRTPHPALEEVRHLYAPLRIILLREQSLQQEQGWEWTITVQNLATFRDLSWLSFEWSLQMFDEQPITAAAVAAQEDVARLVGGAVHFTKSGAEAPAGSTVSGTCSCLVVAAQAIRSAAQVAVAPSFFLTVTAHNASTGTLVKATQFSLQPEQFMEPPSLGLPPVALLPSSAARPPAAAASSSSSAAATVVSPASVPLVSVSESAETIWLRAGTDGAIELTFDKQTGTLQSLTVDGQPLLACEAEVVGAPPPPALTHTLWRAPTDNDEGGIAVGMPSWLASLVKRWPNPLWSYADRWRYAGLPELVSEVLSVTTTDGTSSNGSGTAAAFTFAVVSVLRACNGAQEATTRVSAAAAAPIAHVRTDYTVTPDGRVQVDVNVDCDPNYCPTVLSRVGMTLRLAPELQHLTWLGRGPHENYPDRKAAAHVGLYHSTVAQQIVPYIVPCESGGKTDTQWVALRDDATHTGCGLLVVAQQHKPFALFSALPFSTAALAMSKHTSDLGLDIDDGNGDGGSETYAQHHKVVHLTIDHAHMGVGGDVSWLPCVHDPYLIKPGRFAYSYTLVPLRRGTC